MMIMKMKMLAFISLALPVLAFAGSVTEPKLSTAGKYYTIETVRCTTDTEPPQTINTHAGKIWFDEPTKFNDGGNGCNDAIATDIPTQGNITFVGSANRLRYKNKVYVFRKE